MLKCPNSTAGGRLTGRGTAKRFRPFILHKIQPTLFLLIGYLIASYNYDNPRLPHCMVFLFHNIIYLIFLFGPFTVYVYKLKSIERHLGSHFICNDDEPTFIILGLGPDVFGALITFYPSPCTLYSVIIKPVTGYRFPTFNGVVHDAAYLF